MQHVCRSCRETTEITEARARRGDWICSPCCNAAKRERYRTDADFRARVLAGKHTAPRTDALRQQEKERFKKRLDDPAERRRITARRHAHYLVQCGKLVPQPCEVCGIAPTEAHHDDYSRPADVRWLCRPHHRQHHAKYA